MKIRAAMAPSYAEAFIRLIYPAECGACQKFLELEEKNICRTCCAALDRLRFPLDELNFDPESEYLDNAWTLYSYESPLKEIIAGIKFHKKRALISLFAFPLQSLLSALAAESQYDFIVPVPMDHQGLMNREFNQSHLLAKLAAKQCPIRLNHKILRKRHATAPQSSLGREERQINLFGCFEVSSRRSVEGRSLLLVDDIFTTGATSDSAAEILKQNGAQRVDLLALARTSLAVQPATAPQEAVFS